MSGHSKWANIKNKKGKSDAARSNVFTKIGRELAISVKQGGPNPDSNSRLRDVIAKAKAANMPNDNIQRSIKKASGELNTVNYEEMVYEGYAPGGVAVIVEALTDNRNRSAGDIRYIFDRTGGSMGNNGCVSYLFNRKGLIVVEKGSMSEDDMMLIALDAGADDVVADEDVFEIYSTTQDYSKVRENIEKAGLTILSADIEYVPDNYIDIDKETQQKVLNLVNKLDEHDDVNNVYHNANIDIEEENE